MKKLEGKIAVVTGASRGIGKMIAETLSEQGAQIIGTATSQKGADSITENLSRFSTYSLGKILQLNDKQKVQNFIAEVNKDYKVDILVNNAGITRDNLLLRMSDAEWGEVIDTNLTSVFNLSKGFLTPMMKKRSGKIISIASIVGLMGNAGQSNYAAAKAGIIGFSKSLAREVASRNICVNVVAPGFIATDMTDTLTAEQREHFLKNIPMKRLGAVEDIAAAVAFLASDDASYVTGQVLSVNGGLYM